MGREIKFRAWQSALKCFAYTDSPHNRLYFNGTWFTAIDRGMADVVEQEAVTVEQFTGLYDREGTPIYEGDIVKDAYQEIDAALVGYEGGGFTSGDTYFADWCVADATILGWIEVIGNVHQNPELLQESADEQG